MLVSTHQVECFLFTRIVWHKSSKEVRGYRAEWISRGTSTRMYTSKLTATRDEAASLAHKYAARNSWIVDTSKYAVSR